MKGAGRRRPEAPTLDLDRTTEPPAPPPSKGRLYVDRADEKVKLKGSTGVVTIIGPAAAGGGGGGALQLVENHDFVAVATSYTFSGLSGDSDEVYFLVFRIVKAVAVAFKVVLRPNGITTNQLTKGTIDGTGSAGIAETTLQITTNGSLTTGDVSYGSLWFDAKTGVRRTGRLNALHAESNGTSVYLEDAAMLWNETVTNITSIDVVCDQANGIGIGSYLRLYRLLKV